MKEIKFKYIYGIKEDVKTYFSKCFTLDQIEGGDQFDEISDNPMYREFQILHRSQFTGLKDRNGLDIYEGDLVTAILYSDDELKPLTVRYGEGGFVIDYIDSEADYWYLHHFLHSNGTIEIIGNIHENPELLK